ncbi:MAG: hypothetical protein KAJ03_07295 [Gammaproteobacteria bacterium]|nr:hypothetical protein [Gammaproteobacteria bacterium]
MNKQYIKLRHKHILSCIDGEMTTLEICKKTKNASRIWMLSTLKGMAAAGLIEQEKRGTHLVHWKA